MAGGLAYYLSIRRGGGLDEKPLLGTNHEAIQSADATARPAETMPIPAARLESSMLRGEVRDEQGEPVPGAEVYSFKGDGLFANAGDCPSTRTCEMGMFEMQAADVVGRGLLLVADGFVPSWVDAAGVTSALESGVPHRYILTRGESLRGRIRDSWGRPIPDATVLGMKSFGEDIDLSEKLRAGPRTVGSLIRTRSDANGEFVLEGLRGFPIRVKAVKAGHVFRQRPEVVSGDPGELLLELSPIARIGLRLTEESGGTPVRDRPAIVQVMGGLEHLDLSDFDISGLPPGAPPDGWSDDGSQYWMTFVPRTGAVSPGEMASPTIAVSVLGFHSIECRPQLRWAWEPAFCEPSDTRLRYERMDALTGKVRIAVHCPIDGVKRLLKHTVLVIPLDGPPEEQRPYPVSVSLGSDGTGELELPEGRYRVTCGRPRGWTLFWNYRKDILEAREVVVRNGGTATLETTVQGGLLDLTVRTTEGDLLPSFSVSFMYAKSSTLLGTWHLDQVARNSSFRSREGSLCAGEGRLEVPLPADEYLVLVEHPGAQPRMLRVEVEEGRRVPLVAELAMTWSGPGQAGLAEGPPLGK